MKLFLSVAIFLVFGLQARVLVFSDIDDTIKTANSVAKIAKLYHFFAKKIYPTQRDLYIELNKYHQKSHEEVDFFYVSAAPDFVFNQQRWLRKHHFPKGEAFLKQFNSPRTYEYKYSTILKILNRYDMKDISAIYFFGDNSSLDPKIYFDLRQNLHLAQAKIYIRDVRTEATEFDNLEQIKLDNINYYFSEIEFFNFSGLNFISSKLKRKIISLYDHKKLIPRYTFTTLKRRIRKENLCFIFDIGCRVASKKMAKILWRDYYLRY